MTLTHPHASPPSSQTSISSLAEEPNPCSAQPQQQDPLVPPPQSPTQEETPVILKPRLGKNTADRFAMPDPPQNNNEAVASIVLGTGMLGSVIIALAWATQVDLNGSFRWETTDLQTGLQCLVPLMALDAAIMLPRYSTPEASTSTAADAGMDQSDLTPRNSRTSSLLSISKDVNSPDLSVPGINYVLTLAQGMKAAQVREYSKLLRCLPLLLAVCAVEFFTRRQCFCIVVINACNTASLLTFPAATR